jgi:Fic family protein
MWAKITKCSHDTALRDINVLITKGILARDDAGGRSTSYTFNLSQMNLSKKEERRK